MKFRYLFLLLFFISLIGLLGIGLRLNPATIPSPLINKSIPKFSLPNLFNPKKNITEKNFFGHITLLNVWATWCAACAEEHSFLLEIANQKSISIYGLDYKDDNASAQTLLKERGNPYQLVASDVTGNVAIDWGVYGTPETFLIDKKGIIRYKQIGPLNAEIWQKIFMPLILKLQNENKA